VKLFFQIDPSIGVSNALASRALYQGLLWSLVMLIPTFFLGRASPVAGFARWARAIISWERIHESLVDLADFMRPTLTPVDSYRVLLRNGPTSGNLEDVLLKKTLVAGTDPVALDTYLAKAYWNLEPLT